MRTRLYWVVLIALASGAGLWFGWRHFAERRGDNVPEAPAGEHITLKFFRNPSPVDAFTATDLDGRRISSAEGSGKVMLVNFWATWCNPCRQEIPELIALQEKYKDQLLILGVSVDEGPPEEVRKFVAEQRINYPVVMATPELNKVFPRPDAVPTTFVLDREGRVVQRHVGLVSSVVAESEVRALAGLTVNATIEEIDRAQGIKLENSANATQIPGVDLGKLTAEQRISALQKLNSDACSCGCDFTLAKCLIEDPTCVVSLPLAREIVETVSR
jgi:thiol-disulfide isomerase/thioredoxin